MHDTVTITHYGRTVTAVCRMDNEEPPLEILIGILYCPVCSFPVRNSAFIVPRRRSAAGEYRLIIIIDNFCIALFSGVHKLTALYNILQHFLIFKNIIHIIMTTNNV